MKINSNKMEFCNIADLENLFYKDSDNTNDNINYENFIKQLKIKLELARMTMIKPGEQHRRR